MTFLWAMLRRYVFYRLLTRGARGRYGGARSNVRVGGCCLPIPLGIFAGSAATVQFARTRR